MTKTATLSGEEMDALMQGIGAAEDAPAGGPRPFALGSQASRPMAALPALDRMGERIARRLRTAIEPFARVKPRVTAEPVAIRRFADWRGTQPEFTSLNTYRFRPLKGGLLLAVEPELISRLVDAFYGGSGVAGASRPKEFSGTEERLLGRLSDALMAVLTEIWSEVLPGVQPQLTGRETNAAFASLVRDEEAVAVCRFTIGLSQGRALPIDIVYPVASLRAVEGELSARVHDDGLSASDWRDRLGQVLGDVRVEARSVLARPELSVAELMMLKPGDVIPISVAAMVPLIVAGRVVAHGKIGDQDGRAAIQIEKVERNA